MKYVNLLFHIYQPPVQDEKVLAMILKQSYEPLFRQFLAFPDLRFTLNINFSLIELLDCFFPKALEQLKTAFEFGTLELTATGAYHPILPLIPLSEVERQIKINQDGTRRLLSQRFAPEGIFPPELAFSGHLVSLFKALGYKWTIADDGAIEYYGSEVPNNVIYTIDGVAVFMRSNLWSNKFANFSGQWERGKEFVDELLSDADVTAEKEHTYLIIALDGETFGHHHPALNEAFLGDIFEALTCNQDLVQTAHLSRLYQLFDRTPQFIPPGSWSTDLENIANRDYFSWWNSYRNNIHTHQWRLADLVREAVRKIGDQEINEEMDKALYSCQFWWASYWRFNPQEVYKGAFNLMRILQKAADMFEGGLEAQRQEGEQVLRQLVTAIEKKRHAVRA